MTERACLIPGVELRTPLTLGFHASDFPAAYDMIEVFSILAASPMTGAMLRHSSTGPTSRWRVQTVGRVGAELPSAFRIGGTGRAVTSGSRDACATKR